ncbi:MAG: ribosome hibernation-promoting factor, HPF/YfiA family [Phycisphaerales bacterium]
MLINISGKHIDLTPTMEEYCEKKADRLTRFFDRIQEIDVVVDKPDREFEVELILHVEHHDPFVGSARGEDFYGCVDGAIEKVSRQVAEHKDKLRNRKHPG